MKPRPRRYDLALKLDPKHVVAHFVRARAFRFKKQWDDAIAEYTKTLELNPDYIPALSDRSSVYRAKENYTAALAVTTAQQVVTLFRSDRERIQGALGRATSSALRVHVSLQERPIQTCAQLVAATGLTVPTVNAALARLGPAGLRLVSELTGQRRDRIYRYDGYLRILGEGTPRAERGATSMASTLMPPDSPSDRGCSDHPCLLRPATPRSSQARLPPWPSVMNAVPPRIRGDSRRPLPRSAGSL